LYVQCSVTLAPDRSESYSYGCTNWLNVPLYTQPNRARSAPGPAVEAIALTVMDQLPEQHPRPLATPPSLIAEDWSFSDLRRAETLWGPHGYHRYPAKFIPQLVRRLIECYSTADSLVGDPFLGSATTGIEALRSGRRFWGSEINPVALLISQAKCAPIEPSRLDATWKWIEDRLASITRVGRRGLTPDEQAVIGAIVTD